MKNYLLSVIIPISIVNKNEEFRLFRLLKLCDFFLQKEYMEVVVIDSSSIDYRKKISKIKNINYNYLEREKLYSVAIVRNYGANISNGNYILFFDVDLIVSGNFLDGIKEDIFKLKTNSKKSFNIYPCFYLNQIFSKRIEKEKEYNIKLFKQLKKDFFEGIYTKFLYLAVNTSTILVNKEHFFNIGQYNENFLGHGYEDFELIHRLYLSYGIVKMDDDYKKDFKTIFPGLYKGFRKHYAYYSLPNLFENKFTFHLWHDRPLYKKYYRNREQNALYFMKLLENIGASDPKYVENIFLNIDFNNFLFYLFEKYEIKVVDGFYKMNKFCKCEDKKSIFYRKIRKMFLNPKNFLLDYIRS